MTNSKSARGFSIRMSENQFNKLTELVDNSQSTKAEIMRLSFDQYCVDSADILKNTKIVKESRIGDMQELIFPQSAYPGYGTPKTNIKVFTHKTAYADIENLGKKTKDTVMEFFYSSLVDHSILHKGAIKTNEEGMNFICFRIHLLKVYCLFSPMQLTITSVE